MPGRSPSTPPSPPQGLPDRQREPANAAPGGSQVDGLERRVGELAARHLKRVHLELGGNSALIILDDVDLDRAASAGAWGSFLHQGQICMTTGRHLVHEAIYDDHVAALAAKAAHLPVGDPASGQVALGPIIDERQRDKVHALVTSSTDAGAKLAAGGTCQGLFYQPTVLSDVTPEMPAFAARCSVPSPPCCGSKAPTRPPRSRPAASTACRSPSLPET
jgi:hypothetical protein